MGRVFTRAIRFRLLVITTSFAVAVQAPSSARSQDAIESLELAAYRIERLARDLISIPRKGTNAPISVLVTRYLPSTGGKSLSECLSDEFRSSIMSAISKYVPSSRLVTVDPRAAGEAITILKDISNKHYQAVAKVLDELDADLVLWFEGRRASRGPQTLFVVLNDPRSARTRTLEVALSREDQCASGADPAIADPQRPVDKSLGTLIGREFTIGGYALYNDREYSGRIVAIRGESFVINILRGSLPFNLNIRPGDLCSGGLDVRTLRPDQQISIPVHCRTRMQFH